MASYPQFARYLGDIAANPSTAAQANWRQFMKRILLIGSIVTLVVLGVAIIGQALVVAQGIIYGSDGLPVDSTPLALTLTYTTFIGGLLGAFLCLVTGVLGLVTAASRNQYRWFLGIILAGALAASGVFGVALIVLSGGNAVSFATPFALIPLITGFYSLQPDAGIAQRTSAI